MKIFDGIFDRLYIEELAANMISVPWYADNVANKKTHPYQLTGSHRLFGAKFFERINEDIVRYNENPRLMFLSEKLITDFYHICRSANVNLRLLDITANLQFMGMDGTNHLDGHRNFNNLQTFIMMLGVGDLDNVSGGEFVNETLNSIVDFKQGRVIMPDIEHVHRGLAFHQPHIPRISIKFTGQKLN